MPTRRTTRRPLHVAALLGFLLVARPGAGLAQEVTAFEIAGGYTFLGSSAIVDGYGAGWVVGGGWNVTNWLALNLELGGTTHEQALGLLEIDAGFLTLLAGPRVSWSAGRLRPFAQLLAGSAHVDLKLASDFPFPSTGDFDDSHPALQGGGGVDVPIDRSFLIRIAFDYRRVFATEPFSQRRVLTALVYRIGRRR